MPKLLTIRIAVILAAIAAATSSLHAQDDPEYRMEIGAGGGMTGYLGDFNGNLTSKLQPGASILWRYIFNPWTVLRVNVGYGKLKGEEGGTETWYPDYHDGTYEFSNALYDMALTYEYNFWPYGTGWDYRGAKRLTPFVFAGIGVAVAKTEEKTRAAFSLPIGIGLKYKIGERVNLGLEWAINFTSSDWLDGVKDPYLVQSSGLFKNTDCFSRLQLTLTYSFAPKCTTCNKE